MKILLLLLLPCISLCQNKNLGAIDTIPKGVNTILVSGVTYDEVMNHLLDAGYMIEKADKEFQTIKTEYKTICESCIPQMYYYVRIKDSVAVIRGKWRSNGNFITGIKTKNDEDDSMVFTIENRGAKVPRETFRRMNNFANNFKKPVQYLTSK